MKTPTLFRDQRGFVGAEKALLACLALAPIALVSGLLNRGADRADQDAASPLKDGFGSAGTASRPLPKSANHEVRT